MNIKGIIAISGRPGLFKVVAQSKNSVIVESMIDKKRFPAYASEKISTLEDISIFTYDDDVKLTDVFKTIFDKYEGGECISHKSDTKELAKTLTEILPNFDQERVYPSDIKKIFQWYNLIHGAGLMTVEEEATTEEAATETEKPVKEVKAKKDEAKKPIAAAPNKSAKPANVKKAAPVKTGVSRGK
jgi:hypothetical protein